MSSSISASSGHAQRLSPRDMLQSTLASGVSSGKIAASDKEALSSAIDTVDASLKGSGPSRGSRQAPPSRDDMQAKVESLIDQQVSDGKLTSEQASELKQVFSETFAAGPDGPGAGGGRGGPGGPRGPGGPSGPPPQKTSSDDEEDSLTTLTISTDNSDIASLLQDFMKQLMEKASSSSYGSAGQSATKASGTSFMLDLQA